MWAARMYNPNLPPASELDQVIGTDIMRNKRSQAAVDDITRSELRTRRTPEVRDSGCTFRPACRKQRKRRICHRGQKHIGDGGGGWPLETPREDRKDATVTGGVTLSARGRTVERAALSAGATRSSGSGMRFWRLSARSRSSCSSGGASTSRTASNAAFNVASLKVGHGHVRVRRVPGPVVSWGSLHPHDPALGGRQDRRARSG